MRFYLLSDNTDTLMGMRLAGIEGRLLHTAEELETALHQLMGDEEIGIILITGKLMDLCPQLIRDLKLNAKRPLLVGVADRHGTGQLSASISRYVKEAVGIDIS